MPLYPYRGIYPTIDPTAFVHPDAVVIGDVHIGAHSSIWPGVVVRGDVNHIRIGECTNIQDGSILHVARPTAANPAGYPLLIGDRITIGHRVVLHACTLANGCMVGMGAVVMDGCVVGEQALIGAGSLLPVGKQVAAHELWMGSPAQLKRILSAAEQSHIAEITNNYQLLAKEYQNSL